MEQNLSAPLPPPKKKSFAKKVIKRIFLFALLLLVLVVGGAALIVGVFGDEIKKIAIEQINKELKTEIKVKEIDFTILKTFPNASIQFKQIACKEVSNNEDKRNLIEAEEISLSFNLVSIFKKNYTFNKLTIKNGVAFIHIDQNGNKNFDILKTKKEQDSLETSSSSFQIEDISLINVDITYLDDYRKQEYAGLIHHLRLSGKFSNRKHSTEGKADLFLRTIRVDDNVYVADKNITLSTGFDIDLDKDSYTITKGKVSVENMNFDVSGKYVANDFNEIDFLVEGKKLDIQACISLLPERFRKFEKEYKSSGGFYFKAIFRGPTSKGQSPVIQADFGVENGEITYIPTKMVMKNVNVKGGYNNGENRNGASSTLTLQSLNGKINDTHFEGFFSIKNFIIPTIAAKINASLNLADIMTFFPVENIQNMAGNAQLNIDFSGTANAKGKFTSAELQNSKIAGNIVLNNVFLKIKQTKNALNDCSGNLRFENSDLFVEKLTGFVGNSDFNVKGIVYNLPAYLVIPDAPLKVEASLVANHAIIDELVAENATENASKAKSEAYKLVIPKDIDFSLDLNVAKVSFRKFSGTNILGKVIVRNEQFVAKNIVLNAMDGAVYLNGAVNASLPGIVKIGGEARVENLSVQQLFYQFENFGQNTIEDKHLKGKISAKASFSTEFSDDLKANLDAILATIELRITNGELIEFKPLQPVSKFIKLADLNHIKFENLFNLIEIKNKTIYISEMAINNSAMNLVFSGTHQFDNYVDYHFNLLLGDFLAAKFKKNNAKQAEFGELVEENERGARIFLRMKGFLDNPAISYDGKKVREKIKDDMKKEQSTIKQMLFEDFGLFKKDSTIRKEDALPKKEDKNKVKNQEGFEVDF